MSRGEVRISHVISSRGLTLLFLVKIDLSIIIIIYIIVSLIFTAHGVRPRSQIT